MNYSDQLKRLSDCINGTEGSLDRSTLQFIKNPENISLYQKNLLGTIFEAITEHFPVTKKYLGSNNTKFMVHNLVSKGLATSVPLNQVPRQFIKLLEELYSTHQDDLIIDLARVDLLWSSAVPSSINLPAGIFAYWERLNNGASATDLTINFDGSETLRLIVKNGSKYLVCLLYTSDAADE